MTQRAAGSTERIGRYSPALREADFDWEPETLEAFLADPQAIFPGTCMTFPGIAEPAARADLVAFLSTAAKPGAAEKFVNEGMIPAALAQGQGPPPLGDAPLEARVTKVRHCGDGFLITTEDGAEPPTGKRTSASRSTAPRAARRRASRSCSGPGCAAIASP